MGQTKKGFFIQEQQRQIPIKIVPQLGIFKYLDENLFELEQIERQQELMSWTHSEEMVTLAYIEVRLRIMCYICVAFINKLLYSRDSLCIFRPVP